MQGLSQSETSLIDHCGHIRLPFTRTRVSGSLQIAFVLLAILHLSFVFCGESAAQSKTPEIQLSDGLRQLRSQLSKLSEKIVESNRKKDRAQTAKLIDEHRKLAAQISVLSAYIKGRQSKNGDGSATKQDSSDGDGDQKDETNPNQEALNDLYQWHAEGVERLEELKRNPQADPDGEIYSNQEDYLRSLENEISSLNGAAPPNAIAANPLGADGQYQQEQQAEREQREREAQEEAERERREQGGANAYIANLPETGMEEFDNAAARLRAAQDALADHALLSQENWSREQALAYDGDRQMLIKDIIDAENELIVALAGELTATESDYMESSDERENSAQVPLSEAAEILEEVELLEERYAELKPYVESLQRVGGGGLRGMSFAAHLEQAVINHENAVGRYNEARNQATARLYAARVLRDLANRSRMQRGVDRANRMGANLVVDREWGSAQMEQLLHDNDVLGFRQSNLARRNAVNR